MLIVHLVPIGNCTKSNFCSNW